LLTVAHELRRPRATKAAQSSEEIQRLEDCGLPLSIATDEEVLTFRELYLSTRYIPKLVDLNLFDTKEIKVWSLGCQL